jgi:hypothetical protein
VNRDLQYIITGFSALVIAGLLLIFVFLPPEDEPPIPIQPIGEEITDSPDEEEEESPTVPLNFTEGGRDRLHIYDNITAAIDNGSSGSVQSNGGQGSGGSGGGGGGGASRDRTPPTVTGIFSRPADTGDGWYTHPFKVTWVGEDARSGIDFCDPPTDYSGPDGSSIILEGHCTDRAGNVGTGHVTFNYNATRFVPLLSYNLVLSSDTINVGSDMTATATTNDTSITQVVFSWKDPSNSTAASNVKTVTLGSVRTAIDIFTVPNVNGLWTIDAHFKNGTGNEVAALTKTFTVVSPAINYTYSLTLDRENVKINNPILATAGTNDSSITEVVFVWSDPETSTRASHVQPLSPVGAAQDSFIPDELGEWKVDARFNNATHADVAIKSKLFIVTSDGNGGGGNQPPVAVDDAATTLEDVPVIISVLANDSDPDGDSLSISSSTQAGNGSVTKNLDGTITYTPMTNYIGPDSFTYRISDGSLESNTATVTITITPVDGDNHPPTANAGLDQTVNEQSFVSLSGSATDVDNDDLEFSWSQISGQAVILTGANTLTPSFTAASINHTGPTSLQLSLTFELVVEDEKGARASDTVVITVNDVNKIPVADAGIDQRVNERTLVQLSGLGSSDPDGNELTFNWKQTAGISVVLTDANTATPSFKSPAVTEKAVLTFELFVSDGFGGNSTDSVNIKVLNVTGGGDDDDCDGGGKDDKHKHGDIHKHKPMDDDKHKHGDIHKHKDKGGNDDECNGGGNDHDKDKDDKKKDMDDKDKTKDKKDKANGGDDKKSNDNSNGKEKEKDKVKEDKEKGKDDKKSGEKDKDNGHDNGNDKGASDKNKAKDKGGNDKEDDAKGGSNNEDKGDSRDDHGDDKNGDKPKEKHKDDDRDRKK